MITECLSEAGFANTKPTYVPLEKNIADTAAFARGVVFGNPIIDQNRGARRC